MKKLFIEPLDVLMFRSERPFIARESHVAKLGIISPLTFEGAIKSKIFFEFCEKKDYSLLDFQKRRDEDEKGFKERVIKMMKEDKELEEVLQSIGHPAVNSKPSFQVVGVFFSKRDEREEWFPVPNDIAIIKKEKKDGKGNEILKLSPILREEFRISGTENYACFSTYSRIDEKRRERKLISLSSLIRYLKEDKKPEDLQIMNVPYSSEIRTGIGLERSTKRTVEGYLYVAEFLRLKEDWEFAVWMDGDCELVEKYCNGGIIKLGGEGKSAICVGIDEINLAERFRVSELIEGINGKGRFKLYLSMPSYFNGCVPPNEILEYELGVNELKLVAALPGKPIYVGGYDLAMNREKSLQRWVSAGAVYYYKFSGKIKENLSLPITITNMEKNVNMRGAFIGVW